MKKTLLTGMALLNTVFASSTTDYVTYDDVEKNVGHFTISLIANKSTQDLLTNGPIPAGIGLGYQTQIINGAYIQSALFEVNSTFYGEPLSPNTSEEASTAKFLLNMYPTMKLTGFRYLDSTEDTRLFVCAGPYTSMNIARISESLVQEETEEAVKVVPTVTYSHTGADFGATIGCGVEIGESAGMINTLKLEYKQPLVNGHMASIEVSQETETEIEKTVKESLVWNEQYQNLGTLTLTYSVGF